MPNPENILLRKKVICTAWTRGFKAPQVSRKTHRCRGAGWLGEIHADLPRETLAGTFRGACVFHGVEFVEPREAFDEQGQDEPFADADDFLAHPREIGRAHV